MAIPDYQLFFLPALKVCEDGQEHRPLEVSERFADEFNLTEDERVKLLPSGSQTVLANRTNWALYYLYRAGLLSRPKRGRYRINEAGRALLAQGKDRLTNEDLKEYPSFR